MWVLFSRGCSLSAKLLSSVPGLGRSAGEEIGYPLQYSWASLVTQLAKNLPAMWETWFDLWVGKIPWRREQSTPVFWPGEFHGLYSLWGHKELDTTEQPSLALPFFGIGMKTDLFHPVATVDFSKFASILNAALSQHHLSGFEIAPLEFHHLHQFCS